MALGSSQPERRTGMKAEFSAAIPSAVVRVAGNPPALNMLSRIETRAGALRQRAIDHHKAFEDRWTAKEAIRIWKRHLAEHAKHPAPAGVQRDVMPEAIMKMAAQNVRARTIRRLSLIKAIKTRMGNAVARNVNASPLRQSFAQAAAIPQNIPQTMKPLRMKQ